jgi:RNA polymerase sigma-70 factor (ECF subfamily)
LNRTDPSLKTQTGADRAAELLALRCQLGEAEAFEELVERWHLPLWKYVRRLAPDDHQAEEILQDVWLRIVRGLPNLREPSRLAAWMFRIARYASLDRMRGSYSRRELLGSETDLEFDQMPSGDASHVGLDTITDEVEELRLGLLELPLMEREVLTLFYLRELSLAQVADVLEIPVGTVKSRLFRARKLLKQQLETLRKGAME